MHVHLEGCLDLDQIVALAAKIGAPLPRPRDELLKFTGLAEFLRFLDWMCGLYQTPDHVADAAYAFCLRMARSGVHYADVIVNPTHWASWRKDVPGFIAALDRGFSAAERDGLPGVGLCVSLLRQQSADEALELVETMISLRAAPGWSLFRQTATRRWRDAQDRASPRRSDARAPPASSARRMPGNPAARKACAMRSTISAWTGSITGCGRSTIPISSRGFPRRASRWGLPTSNLTLGLYPGLTEHPIDALRRAGVPVSVNTDDPVLLAIDLPEEYRRCAAAYGWDAQVCREVAATSIEASFADADAKARMRASLAQW